MQLGKRLGLGGYLTAAQPPPIFPVRSPHPLCSLPPCPPGCSEWQSGAVRERRQQLSSSTFLVPKHPGKDYVALCVIARDAHADVLEWLNHHIRCAMHAAHGLLTA